MRTSWQEVRDEALRRIHDREWRPGAQIPNEADLAAELGCARTTVNRALRELAKAGWLERRRRAGTRVAPTPERRAELAIPLIRQEIAAGGATPGHEVLRHEAAELPPLVRAALGIESACDGWHSETLYLADGAPFAHEDRWVNRAAAPGYGAAPLCEISPNEWLVRNAGFAHGTLDYGAEPAPAAVAAHLGCAPGTPVMVLERRTFGPEHPVTLMRLTYAPGHRLRIAL